MKDRQLLAAFMARCADWALVFVVVAVLRELIR